MHTFDQISLPRLIGMMKQSLNIFTSNSHAFIRYPVGPGNLNFKRSGSPIFVAVIVKAEESTVFSFTNNFVNLDRNSTETCLKNYPTVMTLNKMNRTVSKYIWQCPSQLSNYLSKSTFAFTQYLQLLSLGWYIKCPSKSFFPFWGSTVAHYLQEY